MNKNYLAGMLSGFVGGMLGAYVLAHLGLSFLPRQAAATAQAASTPAPNVVSARRIRLLDATGRARAEIAMSPDGGPGLFFYDSEGRNRLVLGLYSAAENEDPFVVLTDTHQAAAGIFRRPGRPLRPSIPPSARP